MFVDSKFEIRTEFGKDCKVRIQFIYYKGLLDLKYYEPFLTKLLTKVCPLFFISTSSAAVGFVAKDCLIVNDC